MCMFKSTEVSALQATIAELEDKLLKVSYSTHSHVWTKETTMNHSINAGQPTHFLKIELHF